MNKKVLAIAVIVLAIGGSILFFTKSGKAPAVNTPSTVDQSSTNNTSTDTTTKNAAVIIIYTNDGFSSEKFTANVGDVVAVKNQSSEDMQFSSDPHPIHTGDKELNQQTIPAGGSLTFKVTVKGSHGFHDHLNTNHTGILVVE